MLLRLTGISSSRDALVAKTLFSPSKMHASGPNMCSFLYLARGARLLSGCEKLLPGETVKDLRAAECFRVVQLCFWLVMKRGGEGLGKVSPDRAAKPSQAQRREGAGQQRHQPPSYESSPAAAAASRPSFSPQGSTADARSATEAAVRESPICAFFRTVAPLCMLRAPPAPTQRACCQHRKCRVLRGIYIPSSPI